MYLWETDTKVSPAAAGRSGVQARMRLCQALDLSIAHGVDIYRPHWLLGGAPSDVTVRVINGRHDGREFAEPILVLSGSSEPWLPGHEDLFADDWEVI